MSTKFITQSRAIGAKSRIIAAIRIPTHTQTEKGLSILFLQDLPTDLPQITHLHTYTHNSSCMKTETTYGVTTSRTTPWAALPAYPTFHCLPYLFIYDKGRAKDYYVPTTKAVLAHEQGQVGIMTSLVQTVTADDSLWTPPAAAAAPDKASSQHIEIIARDRAHPSPPTGDSTSEAAYRNDLDISNATSRAAQDSVVTPSTIDLNASYLISSPYNHLANRLVLDDLEIPYRLFAFALTSLKPIRDDYATAPYLESFNWPDVFALLRDLCRQTGFAWKQLSFYTVIFRSVLLPGIDRGRLALLDQKSHEEACASGGLLKYWFGSTDAELKNLATCEYSPR